MRLDGVVGLGGMQRLSGPRRLGGIRRLGGMRRLGGVRGRHRSTIAAVALTLLAPLVLVAVQRTADASTLPSGFRDTVVLSGMNNPTVMQFAPDGRIFVGQKNGVIKVFQSLTDTAPVTFADLSTEVDDYWDRGLLGLALDPAFPADRKMPLPQAALGVRRRPGGLVCFGLRCGVWGQAAGCRVTVWPRASSCWTR